MIHPIYLAFICVHLCLITEIELKSSIIIRQ